MVFVTEVEISSMASGLDAHTSPLLGHRTDINHVGLRRAHDLDVQLLCPHGGELPRALSPAWRAVSMRIRLHCLVTVLILTMWAFAGLMTWTCSCCALMGVTCPGLCASSSSVLPTPSYATPVYMY